MEKENVQALDWWASLEGLQIPLLLINNENVIVRATQAASELLGFTNAALRQQTLVQITHPSDRNEETNSFIDVFYGGKKSSDVLKQFRSPQRGTISIRQRIFPLTNDGEITHALVYLTYPMEQASVTEVVLQLKYTLELFDTGEFDGAYNASILQRAKQLLAQLQSGQLEKI